MSDCFGNRVYLRLPALLLSCDRGPVADSRRLGQYPLTHWSLHNRPSENFR